MQYEIKWLFNEFSFDTLWEKIKRDLMKKVLSAAREKADDILRHIKAGHSDYIKKYWNFGDYKKFYFNFDESSFEELSEEIIKYKKEIEQPDVIVARGAEIKNDEDGKLYILLRYYYIFSEDAKAKFKIELDCYNQEIEKFIYKEAERSRGLNNLNCRPLDNNLVWAFLEWRCNFNTLVLQCLWINRL